MSETVRPARLAILDRIRAANVGTEAATRQSAYDTLTRDYDRAASMDRDAILEMFTERLHEYDAQVFEATSSTLHEAIREALAPYRGKPGIVASNFPKRWLPEGLHWNAEADADAQAFEKAEGAVVTCEVAIAHTGTIVLRDARRATLLPDRLLCVVRESQVVETVPEAVARLQSCATDAMTFISGPSATADIEMIRIRGVHGPRFLDVVILREN